MNVAIIAAAGQGTRLAGKRPKQFLELLGVPIIIHTLKAFEQCEAIDEIIVVLSADEVPDLLLWLTNTVPGKLARLLLEALTRAESVLHGLLMAGERSPEIVAVHDGVRPFVTPDEISRTVEVARREGAAIMVSTPVDTIKEVSDGLVTRTINRQGLRNALTPQCFSYKLLRRAYEDVDVLDPSLTDESALVERLGVRIAVVEGSTRNIKITRPEDIVIAEAILRTVGSGQ